MELNPDSRVRHRRAFVTFALGQVCLVFAVLSIWVVTTPPAVLIFLVLTAVVGLVIGCVRVPGLRQVGVFLLAGIVAGLGWLLVIFLWSIIDGHHGPLMIGAVLTPPLAAASGGLYVAIVAGTGNDA